MATQVIQTTFENTYKDDFRDSDNYYKVLFNNGRALQQRELNQLQSIIQSDFKTNSDFSFRHGSAASGGGCQAYHIPGLTMHPTTRGVFHCVPPPPRINGEAKCPRNGVGTEFSGHPAEPVALLAPDHAALHVQAPFHVRPQQVLPPLPSGASTVDVGRMALKDSAAPWGALRRSSAVRRTSAETSPSPVSPPV